MYEHTYLYMNINMNNVYQEYEVLFTFKYSFYSTVKRVVFDCQKKTS